MTTRRFIREISQAYAQQFHAFVAAKASVGRLNDVEVPDYGHLVASMRPDFRGAIGHAALQHVACTDAQRWQLAVEVSSGVATLIQDGEGEVLRNVAVSVLKIQRPSDGCLLVCL